jgi:hypothetical protein
MKKLEYDTKERFITVILSYVFKMIDTPFTVSNKTTGEQLKKLYADKTNCPLNKYKLRLLYKGQEISNEHPLFYHNIENNAKIHVSIAEL